MVVRISDKTRNYSKVTKLLVKPYYIEHPDLPNGIVCIEVCEYDDKDISDELAEAIIKEFKVVELLDVE